MAFLASAIRRAAGSSDATPGGVGYLIPLVAASSALAWIAIWRLGESPWGRLVHVHHPHELAAGGASAFPALITSGLVFVLGWIIMVVAMMLPTTIPLLQIFQRLTRFRADATWLTGLVVLGYLTAWAAFGLLVFGASSVFVEIATARAWFVAYPRVPVAGLFLLAGVFQFSSLKYRCLDKCRSPLSFVTARWQGHHEFWQSFRLGVDHGAFCVACCWALMLLMFAAGTASIAWMLLLGGVMAVEKNTPLGPRLGRPLGGGLIASGVGLLLV